jgi:hypothetical protein
VGDDDRKSIAHEGLKLGGGGSDRIGRADPHHLRHLGDLAAEQVGDRAVAVRVQRLIGVRPAIATLGPHGVERVVMQRKSATSSLLGHEPHVGQIHHLREPHVAAFGLPYDGAAGGDDGTVETELTMKREHVRVAAAGREDDSHAGRAQPGDGTGVLGADRVVGAEQGVVDVYGGDSVMHRGQPGGREDQGAKER